MAATSGAGKRALGEDVGSDASAAKRVRDDGDPVQQQQEQQEEAASVGLPLHLMHVRGIPDWANDGFLGVKLSDVVCGELRWALVSNYVSVARRRGSGALAASLPAWVDHAGWPRCVGAGRAASTCARSRADVLTLGLRGAPPPPPPWPHACRWWTLSGC